MMEGTTHRDNKLYVTAQNEIFHSNKTAEKVNICKF